MWLEVEEPESFKAQNRPDPLLSKSISFGKVVVVPVAHVPTSVTEDPLAVKARESCCVHFVLLSDMVVKV